MPEIGNSAIGLEIGNHSWGYYEYAQCPFCGYSRWVAAKTLEKSKHRGVCQHCFGSRVQKGKPRIASRGEHNGSWKGGRQLLKSGYIRIPIYPEDPFIKMGADSFGHHWILEDRLVMARHLGRALESWEVVHHRNGIKHDNRLENLELLPDRQNHMGYNILEAEALKLRERVKELEARVTLLEAERVLAEKA